MTEQQLKYYLSQPRFNVYLAKTNNDFSKAYQLYKVNIELSEAFYPILSVLEVSLRNAINETLKTHFQDEYWFKNSLPVEFLPFVAEATQKLTAQRKTITADRIVAELNFGFWNRLFNRKHTSLLWKPLRLIFKNTPKHLRQRDTISDSLYRIRTLRNRIYHYEPIFGNLQDIENQHNEILTFITWIDNDLPKLLTDIDRFNNILQKAKVI
ncbi:Abi-like protein [Paenimyroides aquimaris]|uniref:Abi-like protein n=1 Tax=Paenimyroides marinum TaxID=1159016 RepID=A0A1H6MK53_9FLAO|nr:Abi family protein [Paenimyroides aquimaris]SEI02092.1 Abi-like protein [Paenimyroides aquimaris]